MKHRSVLTAFLVLTGTACFTQVPFEMATPPAATHLMARLTDSGVVVVERHLGPGAAEVEGVVASTTPEAWTLNVTRVAYRGGSSTIWNREPVTFPRHALTNITVRRVDKKRSVLAFGLGVAGALALSRVFGTGAGSDDEFPPIVVPEH